MSRARALRALDRPHSIRTTSDRSEIPIPDRNRKVLPGRVPNAHRVPAPGIGSCAAAARPTSMTAGTHCALPVLTIDTDARKRPRLRCANPRSGSTRPSWHGNRSLGSYEDGSFRWLNDWHILSDIHFPTGLDTDASTGAIEFIPTTLNVRVGRREALQRLADHCVVEYRFRIHAVTALAARAQQGYGPQPGRPLEGHGRCLFRRERPQGDGGRAPDGPRALPDHDRFGAAGGMRMVRSR